MNATMVQASDWVALYIDNKLIAEGHSLSARDVLDALAIPLNTLDFVENENGDVEVPSDLRLAKVK